MIFDIIQHRVEYVESIFIVSVVRKEGSLVQIASGAGIDKGSITFIATSTGGPMVVNRKLTGYI